MDISKLTLDDLKAELDNLGAKYHHKAGEDKLRELLAESLEAKKTAIPAPTKEEIEVADKEPSVEEIAASVKELSGEDLLKRLTREQRAMRLVRIIVTPNDPLMSSYPGLIFTVGSSKVNEGRMIKKFVPFNNDEGYHVPHIIYEVIQNAEMQKFKTVKMPNGEKGLQAYITKKFNVQILDDLSREELELLASAQKARGDA